MLNQMAGPLFYEVAEGLAPFFANGVELFTGHPDTLAKTYTTHSNLKITPAPVYDRRTILHRLSSWIRYLLATVPIILSSRKNDFFLIASNPPVLGGWFLLLNWVLNRRYAILVYDIHPDILVMMGVVGVHNPVLWLWRGMNRLLYRDAEVVITLGKHMAHRLRSNYVRFNTAIEVISPWADIHSIVPLTYESNPLAQEFNPERKNVVLYSGNMGISHDINSLLEAAKYLHERQDILFLFIGSGKCWQMAVEFKSKNSLTNIKIYPFQPEEKLPFTMALASISLVSLGEGAEELMVPSKVFYYMAAGSAVVGICNGDNELRDVIEGSDCGLCVPTGQPRELADKVISLIDDNDRLVHYRKNARNFAIKNYSREAGVGQFISVFTRLGWMKQDSVNSSC